MINATKEEILTLATKINNTIVETLIRIIMIGVKSKTNSKTLEVDVTLTKIGTTVISNSTNTLDSKLCDRIKTTDRGIIIADLKEITETTIELISEICADSYRCIQCLEAYL